MRLADAIAVVTGAAHGMGRGIALALAEAGCHVALVDVAGTDELRAQLNETRDLVEAVDRRTLVFRTDVTNALDVRGLVAEVERVFGRIDVLVNNAGVASRSPAVDLTVEEFRRILEVNVLGTFLCCKTAAPAMIARNQGSIVNIASVAGIQGIANLSHYSASEFAVIGFTQALALELAPAGVRVNAVCPGLIEASLRSEVLAPPAPKRPPHEQMRKLARERVPLGRPQTPVDVGAAVVFLCQADNITGQALTVAGGLIMT